MKSDRFVLIFMFLVVNGFSSDNFQIPVDSVKQFMSVEKHQYMFKKAQEGGALEKGRESFKDMCKKEEDVSKCECFNRELDLVSDTLFFYESIVAYQRFLKKVKAKKIGDEKLYQELINKEKFVFSLSKFLESRCDL
ncbi:hypothetical protein OAA91_01260 [Fibrobacterales bacterium]|nr:hypothetical protein [Fibrobacterales bacterium]